MSSSVIYHDASGLACLAANLTAAQLAAPLMEALSATRAAFAAGTTLSRISFWAACFPWAIVAPLGALLILFSFLPSMAMQLLGVGEGPRRKPRGVWTIHGKQYDLSMWAHRHPGGAWMLELGRNRDCTALFESYHVFANRKQLDSILRRFELPAESTDSGADLVQLSANSTGMSFDCTFHEDVKEMARRHFTNSKHKMKPGLACVMLVLLGVQFALMYLFINGSRPAIVLTPLVAWIVMANIVHDASHNAVSSRPWVNRLATLIGLPFFFAPTTWHIQHVVQHHIFTNDDHDVDLYHFLPIMRLTRRTRFSAIFRLQWLLVFFAIPTATAHLLWVVPMDLLIGARDAVTKRKRYEECENCEDLVAGARAAILVELALGYAWFVVNVCTQGVFEAWWRCAMAYSIAAYIFIFFTQGAHLNKDCSIAPVPRESWAKRQVETAVNFQPDSPFWCFVTGGLNLQGIHHILPSIHSSHLADMWPEFQKVCKQHKVELKETPGMLGFATGFFAWVLELSGKDSD